MCNSRRCASRYTTTPSIRSTFYRTPAIWLVVIQDSGFSIFKILLYDPAKNPSNPKRAMKISLAIVYLEMPDSQNVTSSINGGKIKASIELLTDPTKEMTELRFGIAAARKTEKKFFHYEMCIEARIESEICQTYK